VSSVVKGFAFPITRSRAITRSPLCSVPFVVQGFRPAQAHENWFFDLVVKSWVFRSPDAPITRSFATLCLRTSASAPPPHRCLVENKGRIAISKGLSKALSASLFPVFQGV
jgi:hypothetical protein